MLPEDIAAAIDRGVTDSTGHAVPALADRMGDAIAAGRAADADLVFVAARDDAGQVVCGLVCGCSLIVGMAMPWLLGHYLDGRRGAADDLIGKLRAQAVHDLGRLDLCLVTLASDGTAWRSFAGACLPDVDQVLVRVRRDRN